MQKSFSCRVRNDCDHGNAVGLVFIGKPVRNGSMGMGIDKGYKIRGDKGCHSYPSLRQISLIKINFFNMTFHNHDIIFLQIFVHLKASFLHMEDFFLGLEKLKVVCIK